jgi:uncharacterized membrane protein YvbJ
MKCTKCGFENIAGRIFCLKCGVNLKSVGTISIPKFEKKKNIGCGTALIWLILILLAILAFVVYSLRFQ